MLQVCVLRYLVSYMIFQQNHLQRNVWCPCCWGWRSLLCQAFLEWIETRSHSWTLSNTLHFILKMRLVDSHNIVHGNTDSSIISFLSLRCFILILLSLSFFLCCFHFNLFLNSFSLSFKSSLLKASMNMMSKIFLKIFNSIKNSQFHLLNITLSLFFIRFQRLTT